MACTKITRGFQASGLRMPRKPTLVLSAVSVVLLFASPTPAGPEKVAFPSNYKSQVLYTTVDRPDTKQVRDIYASPQAVKAAKSGQPLPNRTVITMEVYRAKVNEKGEPSKDAQGRFIKEDLFGIFVMEKRNGWGTEYGDDLRNGEWDYARFAPDRKLHQPADSKPCLQCHKPYDKQDFVITYQELAGAPASR